MPTTHDAPKSRKQSAEYAAYQRLYKTAQWRRLREYKLASQPLCEWCLQSDVVTEATEVHHMKPHRGDLATFWNGPFVSTCKPCHSSRGQREDHGKQVIVFGPDGWPL